MVVKPTKSKHKPLRQFESSVISYGSKTTGMTLMKPLQFESSVISYGSKTVSGGNDTKARLRVV